MPPSGKDSFFKAVLIMLLGILGYFRYIDPNPDQTARFWHQYLIVGADQKIYWAYALPFMVWNNGLFELLHLDSRAALKGMAVLTAILGLYYQKNVIETYYFGDRSLFDDITHQRLVSPYFINDYFVYLAFVVMMYFDQCRTYLEIFFLFVISVFLGPDISFAVFTWFYEYRELPHYRYVPWKYAATIGLLAYFFVMRVVYGILEPALDLKGHASTTVFGERTYYATICSGLNLLFFMAPNISIKVRFENENAPDKWLTRIGTTLLQHSMWSFISHVLFPFPLYISMGFGLQSEFVIPAGVTTGDIFRYVAAVVGVVLFCHGGVAIGVIAAVVAYFFLGKNFDLLVILLAFNLACTTVSMPTTRLLTSFTVAVGIAVMFCENSFSAPLSGLKMFWDKLMTIPLFASIVNVFVGIFNAIDEIVHFGRIWDFICNIGNYFKNFLIQTAEKFCGFVESVLGGGPQNTKDFLKVVVAVPVMYASVTSNMMTGPAALVSANILVLAASETNGPDSISKSVVVNTGKMIRFVTTLYGIVSFLTYFLGDVTHIANLSSCPVSPTVLPSVELLSSEMLKSFEGDFNAAAPQDRGQHNNSYLCGVGAFSTVDPADLPDRFRHGIYSKKQNYEASIRISAFGSADDYRAKSNGIKGFAMKLTNLDDLPYDALLDFAKVYKFNVPKQQDFLTINRDFFFVADKDLEYYQTLNTFQTSPAKIVPWILAAFFDSFTEVARRFNIAKTIMKLALVKLEDSPLDTHYYSATPYALVGGDANVAFASVKYEFEACKSVDGNICFDMYLREQKDLCAEPIADSTIPWTGHRVKVGTVQGKLQQGHRCDLESFNPYHTLDAHVPLGELNLQRLSVYASGEYRRIAAQEKLYNDSAVATSEDPAGDPDGYNYANYAGFPFLPKYLLDYDITSRFNLNLDGGLKDAIFLYTVFGQGEAIKGRLLPGENFNSYDDYAQVFRAGDTKFPYPGILLNTNPNEQWDSDATFTQQFISGINPGNLYNASNTPWPVNVSKSDLIAAGIRVDELIAEGNLLYIDYEILEGINVEAGTVLYPGVVFFELTPDLTPLAIQLTRDPVANEIYLPRSPAGTWKFAKMHILQADATIHEFVSHLLNTHLSSEPISIGIRRALPVFHPLRQFMEPHYVQLMAINQFGRNSLLAPGGSFWVGSSAGTLGTMQLMQKAYLRYNFSLCHNFKRYIERGGVSLERALKIPRHYYAIDGLRLWDINSEYVSRTVKMLWPTDESVANDSGLQRLYRELTSTMYAGIVGMPDFRYTQSALVEFVTSLIYLNTQQHASFNNEQYESMSYQPARPFRLSQPMPQQQDVTDDYILSAMPDTAETKEIISVTRILCSQTLTPILRSDEVNIFLVKTNATDRDFKSLLSNKDVQIYNSIWSSYQAALQQMDDDIVQRNSKLPPKPFQYDCIRPKRVGQSIDV